MDRIAQFAQLRVSALVYHVGVEHIACITADAAGEVRHEMVCRTASVLGAIDRLRDELSDPAALSLESPRELTQFSSGWGRQLLPASIWNDPPDVLVVVPHAVLHDVPLHLVRKSPDEPPLGCLTALTYVSSMTLFARCASRNPAREADFEAWCFSPEKGAAAAAPLPRSCVAAAVDLHGEREATFDRIAASVARRFPRNTHFTKLGVARFMVKSPAVHGAPLDLLFLLAHGFVDPTDQRLSGLLLERYYRHVGIVNVASRIGPFQFRDLPLRGVGARSSKGRASEVLTLAELALAPPLNVRLAFLLACSAGRGRVLSADEPASLAEGYLRLGASAVVAPMWDLDLDAGEAWCNDFLTAWKDQGAPAALASRAAFRNGLEGGQPLHRAGALVLRGDWV